jgi:hypothetical protein
VVAITAILLALAVAWILIVRGPDWLARHDIGSSKGSSLQTARDAARGRLLTLGAGLFAAGALVFTALNFGLLRRTYELTEQGQVTDRYTKAVEQLGSDKLDVRIGGIYALERIARDSEKDHPTIMAVLVTFIREHSPEQWPVPKSEDVPLPERMTRPDVQAALTVIGRRDTGRDDRPIDLSGANLTRANLAEANLAKANLRDTIFTDADLTGAHVNEAYLNRARLNLAQLKEAHFDSSRLVSAHLEGAHLRGTHFDHATLIGANFTGADLYRAQFTGADLRKADFTHAKNLDDANWGDADLTGAWWPEYRRAPTGWGESTSRESSKQGLLAAEAGGHRI